MSNSRPRSKACDEQKEEDRRRRLVLLSKAAVGSCNERNAAPILGTVSMGKGRRREGGEGGIREKKNRDGPQNNNANEM